MLSEDRDEALIELIDIGRANNGILIPTNDHYLILCSQKHVDLSEEFKLSIPPWSLLEPLMNKVSARTIAYEAGLEVPYQFQPHTEADLESEVKPARFF